MHKKLQSIWLIDDDAITNFLHKTIIEISGITESVQIKETASDALKSLEDIHQKPDLIFLDLNLPGMSGWEFLEEYKNIGQKLPTVIIILTASNNPDDIRRSQSIPEVQGFLTKPLTDKMLQEVIEKHFKDL